MDSNFYTWMDHLQHQVHFFLPRLQRSFTPCSFVSNLRFLSLPGWSNVTLSPPLSSFVVEGAMRQFLHSNSPHQCCTPGRSTIRWLAISSPPCFRFMLSPQRFTLLSDESSMSTLAPIGPSSCCQGLSLGPSSHPQQPAPSKPLNQTPICSPVT